MLSEKIPCGRGEGRLEHRMKTARVQAMTLLSVLLAGFAGCEGIVPLGVGPGDEDPVTGHEPTGSASASSTGGGGAGGVEISTSGPGGPSCGTSPHEDIDGDGFTPMGGDCDDCDPLISPNSVEATTNPGEPAVDEDCDGEIDNIDAPCDMALAIDDANPLSAARAVELCKVSSGPKDWGILQAKYALPDGSPGFAAQVNFELGHGILGAFGQVIHPQGGDRMLSLSSGTARQPNDPGYKSVTGFDKGYSCNHPQGFPKQSPACPGVTSGAPRDGIALEVTLRAPQNAAGFSFDFNFFTTEWPHYVCTSFNDVFSALLAPAPPGQVDGNISFDQQGNVVTVNNVFMEACSCPGGPPCSAGGQVFTCSLGAMSLMGTGFESDGVSTHASTHWLTTTAPAAPGAELTIRWTVHDSGDAILDTTTLVDHWQWITGNEPPEVVTVRKPMP
jgi:hypothetical protein